MKRWLVLLILLAPLAQAQFSGATVDIEADFDLRDAIQDTDVRPSSNVDCGTPTITHKVGHNSLTFNEKYEEVGCMELRILLDVPQDTRSVEVDFGMTRAIATRHATGINPPANILQDMVIRDANQQEIGRFPVFFANEGQPIGARQFSQSVAPGNQTMWIGWHFEDAGIQAGGEPITQAFAFSSELREPSITFTGIPIDVTTMPEERGVADDQLVERGQWSAQMTQASFDHGRPSLTFHFDEPVDVEGITLPGGHFLPATGLDVNIGTTTTVTLSADRIVAAGPGKYVLSATSITPLSADAALAPIAGTGVFLPVAGAAYASYQYGQVRRRAQEARRRMHGALKGSLIGIGVAYLITLLFLFASGEYWTLLISPMPRAGIGYFVTFIGLAVGFIVVAIVGTRHQTRAIEQEVDDLLQTKSKLERSNHDLEHFAYIASHDLQEPLRTISGFSQLLERRYGADLPEGAQRYLQKTIAGSQRMQQLVGDLLAYSRITTHAEIQDNVDLGKIVDTEIDQIRPLIRDTGAKVHRSALPTLPGDRHQLGQVFANLIRNAIKYSRDGVEPEVDIGATLEGRWWHITVKDNGAGIPEDQFDRIFVIFQRLAPRSDTSGTGIGLSIVHRVVERHGGKVWLDSKVGQGTTFHIRLPAGIEHD